MARASEGLEGLVGELHGSGKRRQGVIQLDLITCAECGTPFGVESDMHASLRRDGRLFYCPNGHNLSYCETETDRLKGQLAQEAKRREQLETSVRSAREETEREKRRRYAAKGQLTKLRNQVAEGKCPCCGLLFADLHDHMREAHPEFTVTEPEEEGTEQEEASA